MEGAIVDLGSRRFPEIFFGKSIAFFLLLFLVVFMNYFI